MLGLRCTMSGMRPIGGSEAIGGCLAGERSQLLDRRLVGGWAEMNDRRRSLAVCLRADRLAVGSWLLAGCVEGIGR
jgi:hypothetical protein